MEREFVAANALQRERLNRIVENLTNEQLKLLVYKEGWTISVVLAHLAFGDQRSMVLLRRWAADGVKPPAADDIDSINDGLLPLFLMLPPRKTAKFAVASANQLDNALEKADPGLIADILRSAPGRVNRYVHRKKHLDEMEDVLRK